MHFLGAVIILDMRYILNLALLQIFVITNVSLFPIFVLNSRLIFQNEFIKNKKYVKLCK